MNSQGALLTRTEIDLLSRFPKTRPALPPKLADLYSSCYKENREGRTAASALSQKMESWLHRQVARDMLAADRERSTLEIGAGTLNQLRFEPAAGPYDVVEPFEELYAGSPLLARVRRVYPDIGAIPSDSRYDRITSVAAFEHICNLPEVIQRCGLLLADDGELRISIPSEGSFLWTLGWKMTTGLEFRIRHGLDYGLFMKHEHVNTAREIEQLLRFFFEDVERHLLGFARWCSLYQFYRCRRPRLDRCRIALGKKEVN